MNDESILAMIEAGARDFARQECPLTVVRAAEGGDWTAAEAAWRRLAALGWLELMLPEALGEPGLAAVCTVSEELGRAAYPLAYPETAALIIPLLAAHGTPEQRQAYLPALRSGEQRAALAWPGGGMVYGDSPAAGWPMAVADSRQGWRREGASPPLPEYHLEGASPLLGYCLEGASLLLVPARLAAGVGLLLVERPAGGWQSRPEADMANSAWSPVPLGAHLRAELLGGGALPPESLAGAFDRLRLALSAHAVGLAAEALDLAVGHARERVQFDRPIGSFQAVQQRLADSALEIAAARLLTLEASDAPAPATVAMACLQTGDAARKATYTAQQVWGGMGYTLEVDVQLFFRRARAVQLLLGQPWDLKARIWEGM